MSRFKVLVFDKVKQHWEILGNVNLSVPANVGYLCILDHHYINNDFCDMQGGELNQVHYEDCEFYSCRDGKYIQFQNDGIVVINAVGSCNTEREEG